ncbi:MAG TPA: ankyrin repeat domain-containing protein [Candidatus Methylomirabilis sp.]|nr:ankyrin repeat domain-containing protein [Candidatus Methylomirabilis sp.]
MPSRPIPPRPSLEFDRKQARDLLDALREGDPEARRRFSSHHPRFRAGTVPSAVALHDAQLVIAREYGFSSWPRWKQFVEARQLEAGERAAQLVRAACSGDMRKASTLLAADPSLERFDLYTACVCGATEHVARILEREPALARRRGGPLDREPILYACFSRFLRSDARRAEGIVRVVRLLLDHGADVNAHVTVSEEGTTWIQTSLYGAAGIANNPELTRMLLAAGADVNELQGDPGDEVRGGSYGLEALYHASEFSDITCLGLLLEARPPLHPKRVSYCLARMLDFENPAGVELYLRHGADPNFRIPWMHGRTHLHRAVVYGRSLAIIRLLVEAGGDPNATADLGLTPFRSAVRHGREDVARLLRGAGADESTLSAEDRHPPRVEPDVLCYAAGRNDVESARRLLDAGADPNANGGLDESPPLHWACWRGSADAARLLVEHGADIHVVNRYGGDALDTTIHGSVNCHDVFGGIAMKLPEEVAHGDYPAIVRLLIAAGARLPGHVAGSDSVQEVLRGAGVPDRD